MELVKAEALCIDPLQWAWLNVALLPAAMLVHIYIYVLGDGDLCSDELWESRRKRQKQGFL